ncbi:glycosyl hydrolase family 18 protein [Allorhizocola rhizosphaerae]|uniref:glycosyl hydrolase family 18 protein n=1 Tax=Allorhizocola rhizosphaerae TaxID=1872709 RepID=UPI002482891E|nr:glycoside hydrolase family 18 protein [Allorhizocola rhizosphaerae]
MPSWCPKRTPHWRRRSPRRAKTPASGGKIDLADYASAAQYLDGYMAMTYDCFGAWAAQRPTAPHSPLTCYAGIRHRASARRRRSPSCAAKAFRRQKLLLGIGFYGRGWTGVTQAAPGGSATGEASGIEPGVQDYKILKTQCPSSGSVGGTAYAYCGGNWWSYDTPATIASKLAWARSQSLAGAFFWELSGDTANGELISAVAAGVGRALIGRPAAFGSACRRNWPLGRRRQVTDPVFVQAAAGSQCARFQPCAGTFVPMPGRSPSPIPLNG